MNKFVKFPLVLGIVGVICTGALSLVYEIANPIIQDRINQEANAAILELIPDMDSANDLTDKYEDKIKKYKVSSVKEVIKDNDTYAYAYQVSSVGKNPGIEMMVILDADEQKVLKVKVISQSETGEYWDKVVSNNIVASFEGLGFDELTSVTDAKIGATLSVNGIAAGIENAISFQRYEILGEVNDGVNLSGTERKKLGLLEGQKMVDKTDEFLTKLGKDADKAKKAMNLLNYIDIVDSNDEVVGHAYVTETTYVIFEGMKQKHKLVFMFDSNWENSKLIAVSTSDTMSGAPDYKDKETFPSIVGHPFLEQYNNRTMKNFVDEFKATSDISADLVGGASVTTGYVANNIIAIVRYHNMANK